MKGMWREVIGSWSQAVVDENSSENLLDTARVAPEVD